MRQIEVNPIKVTEGKPAEDVYAVVINGREVMRGTLMACERHARLEGEAE